MSIEHSKENNEEDSGDWQNDFQIVHGLPPFFPFKAAIDRIRGAVAMTFIRSIITIFSPIAPF